MLKNIEGTHNLFNHLQHYSRHRLCELITVMNAFGFFIYIDMLTTLWLKSCRRFSVM